jgi:holo-[acyl-carrier protein] synthase
MIVGIGLDVCSIDRMRRALDRHGERFFVRICSDDERRDLAGRDPAMALAGRFAAKEAFAKALDGAPGVGGHDVEIRQTANGRPRLETKGVATALLEKAGAKRCHVSLSHDVGFAAAVVVLEGGVG